MRLCVLGSGSRGNAILVASRSTRVLVDAGFSARELAARLTTIGVKPESIDALLVTHEHGDHTRGIGVFARRFGTPLYMTEGTHGSCAALLRGTEEVRMYRPGHPFPIGELRVEPFLTAHDAVDPVAVALTATSCGSRVGVATDLGRPTAGIRHALSGCDALVLEANHDEGLLRTGPYPPSVQARIASSHGHLSNRAAADFALELLHPRLAAIVLAHLSAECNHPDLARSVVGDALAARGWNGHLEVAPQDRPSTVLDIPELHLRRGPAQLSLL